MSGKSGKYLVTGGAGYVGSVVAQHLLEAGHEVVVLDNLSTGFREGVPTGASFIEGDIRDAAKWLDASFDAVLHFAAFSQVGESVVKPEKYWDNNVGGTMALLGAMREAGVRKLVFSSTAATYGEPETTPIVESAPTKPTNPYGASKLAVDHMITGEAAAHGLGAVSLRYFNVAGAYGSCGERHDPESHLIPLVLQVAQGRRDAISVFGDDYPTPDGTCIRDYIHVADLADAHLLAVDAAVPGEHLICNLGNGNGFSVREVIETVRQVTGHPIPEVVAPAAPATRRPWSPPPPRPANGSAGTRPARTSRRSSRTPGGSRGRTPSSHVVGCARQVVCRVGRFVGRSSSLVEYGKVRVRG